MVNWIDDLNASGYPGADSVADKARAELPSTPTQPRQTADEAARRWLAHRDALENPKPALTHAEWHRQIMERVTW